MSQVLDAEPPALDRARRPDASRAWIVAFAVGVLIDAVQFAEPVLSLYTIATFAAVGVVLAPASRARLVILCVALATAAVWYLPDIWNHWILVGVLGGTLAIALARGWLVDRERAPTNAELVDRVAPFLRIAFLLTFGFAAFAKLNTGFLDVATSCALWIVGSVPGAPAVPDVARPLVVGSALAVELLVPVLLVFRRTRLLGIAVGWTFHLATAFAGHAAFAGFAWSFYLLFLPRPILERATTLAGAHVRRVTSWATTRLAPAPGILWMALGTLVVGAIAFLGTSPLGPPGRAQRVSATLLFTSWAVATGAILVRAYLGDRSADGPRAVAPAGGGFWAVKLGGAVALSVIVVSAISPYLGFKTQYSFTMYSDLRTEGDRWNHLVVPRAVRIGGWQDDLVTITATGDPDLASELDLRDDGDPRVLPVLEARRLAHRFPDAAVSYRYGDAVGESVRFADDPIVGEDLPWIMRKVARFRPAVTPEATTCQH